MPIDKEIIAEWFRGLQDRICAGLEVADGKGKFIEDKWIREEGGGGAQAGVALHSRRKFFRSSWQSS